MPFFQIRAILSERKKSLKNLLEKILHSFPSQLKQGKISVHALLERASWMQIIHILSDSEHYYVLDFEN